MSTKLLDQYARKSGDISATSSSPEQEETDDHGAFGWLRGVRDKALMLELRKKDGSMKAVGYAWLHEADFEPGVITLHVIGQKIKIIGRNLNAENRPNIRMFHGITRHRVPFIQEADQVTLMKMGDGDTVIEKIEW
jgi:hypothetical protein